MPELDGGVMINHKALCAAVILKSFDWMVTHKDSMLEFWLDMGHFEQSAEYIRHHQESARRDLQVFVNSIIGAGSIKQSRLPDNPRSETDETVYF